MSRPLVLDNHVHLVGHGELGCYISPRFRDGVVFRFLQRHLGLGGLELEAVSAAYVARVRAWLDEASGLDGIVLLAFDGRYDAHGERDMEKTEVLVTNEYLFEVCASDPRLLPGASINPTRRDALDELERVVERGAVCLKTVPNSQVFDPSDARLRPFWRRVAKLGLPWLTHSGDEHTIPAGNQRFGRPELLVPALEEGVVVIAAHGGTGGVVPWGETLPTFLAMLERYENLYGDISALGTLGRGRYFRKVMGAPQTQGRLVYGSDFPVPSSSWPFAHRLGWGQARRIGKLNPLALPYQLMRAMGVGEDVFQRAAEILRIQPHQRQALEEKNARVA